MSVDASATLFDAHGEGLLPSSIEPLALSMRVNGRALPVDLPIGDNYWLHRALAEAAPGVVLVAAPRSKRGAEEPAADGEFGYWGELMTAAAQARLIQGLVIDGHVRDRAAILGSGFPVFCRGVSPRKTSKNASSLGGVGAAVEIGGTAIECDDLIVGDGDGVIVVPRSAVTGVLERAAALSAREQQLLHRIRDGHPLFDELELER